MFLCIAESCSLPVVIHSPVDHICINKVAVNAFYRKVCWDFSVSGTTQCKYPVNSCLCGLGVKKQYIKQRQRFGGYGIERVVKAMSSSGRMQRRKSLKQKLHCLLGPGPPIIPNLTFQPPEVCSPGCLDPSTFLPSHLPPPCFTAPAFFKSCLRTLPIHTLQPVKTPVLTSLVPTLSQPLGAHAHHWVLRPQHSLRAKHSWRACLPNFSNCLCLEKMFFLFFKEQQVANSFIS